MLQTAIKSQPSAQEPSEDFARFNAKWRSIGLSTQPADRKMAEAAIRKAYAASKLDAPQKIVWCGSPLTQGLARSIIIDPEFLNVVMTSVWDKSKNKAGTNFSDHVFDSFCSSMRLYDAGGMKQELVKAIKLEIRTVITERTTAAMKPEIKNSLAESHWEEIWEIVWRSVWDTLWENIDKGIKKAMTARKKKVLDEMLADCLSGTIGRSVKPLVYDEAMESAWGNVRNSVASKIRVQAWDELWGRLQVSVWEKAAFPIGACIKQISPGSPQASGYGQHDAYWLAFHDYFREKEGLVTETEGVSGLMELAKSAGWFMPHTHICWVCERPKTLCFDQDGKLHADDGPAVVYPDGWCLYGTHGELRFAVN